MYFGRFSYALSAIKRPITASSEKISYSSQKRDIKIAVFSTTIIAALKFI